MWKPVLAALAVTLCIQAKLPDRLLVDYVRVYDLVEKN
jgi:hypothetical protein